MKYSQHRRKLSLLTLFVVSLGFLTQFSACTKGEKQTSEDYTFKVPEGWPQPAYNFADNAVSKEKFVLGRTLFYDVQLSLTNTVSCGSCHQAFSAFAQVGHEVSHGIHDRLGKRNSPPLFNLNWHNSFFWDGRANHLEVQPLGPLADVNEMGETLSNVLYKLQGSSNYPNLFKAAFGDTAITSQRMLRSLAVFMGMMVSDQSKYDQYKRGEVALTAEEERGQTIFQANCASCHKPPLFSDFSFRSNGISHLPNNLGTIDSGVGGLDPVTLSELYKFKVPSLRNLKYTRPYMHDGRFLTLEAVLNHYTSIDPNATNLDPILQQAIILSTNDKTDLLAFLNTLNDEKFVKDPRFLEPR